MLCGFLKNRAEIHQATEYLVKNNLTQNNIEPKNWDLAQIVPHLIDGNILDMGSSESFILQNAVVRHLKGDKVGIDLRATPSKVGEITYVAGDLMDTKFPTAYFQQIACLSVIEHEVDFGRFAHEASRLLKPGGYLYVTFDYWHPKIETRMTLFGLKWSVLSQGEVRQLINACQCRGLQLLSEPDWTISEAVIKPGYFAPINSTISYTFGILTFVRG